MHTHFCEVVGHEWQCGDDCICICGLPMEGHDHSDCPIELRACAEHAGQDGLTAEVSPDARRLTSAFCPQSASDRAPTVNAAVPTSPPALAVVSACGVTTCTWNTARKSKPGTSLIIAPKRPRN